MQAIYRATDHVDLKKYLLLVHVIKYNKSTFCMTQHVKLSSLTQVYELLLTM